MDKLTVSIVNYNGGQFIIDCLNLVKLLSNEVSLKVYVVDNASKDGSIEKIQENFPEVETIINKENLGFGKSQNLVLKKTKDEYILILNPDVEIKKGVLKKLLEYLESHKNIGVITPKIILQNGELDLAAHRGFPTPLASFLYTFFKNDSLYHLTQRDMNEIHEVDSISGAFFLTRKDVLASVGYFDEDFFMYGEDIDLCFRIKEAGYKVVYYPEVEVIHHKGISSGLKKDTQKMTTADKETKMRSVDAFYEAMKIFYRKHYEKNYAAIVNWLVYLGINLKWMQAKRKLVV
ncbi:MAG: Glycosyl transferase family 2 [uncultured bacterium]|uniref:Glycosyl transferase family 2 n=3 Tax=Candidatus Daviesiibacteriota TaxID=1752718 RepID=A0A0G0ETD8_9BACT|nr:MAG: Glycosyl transferase family 2 [uncultured bacterium]KKQ08827.1 MAG: Glycosyl transferase family 2 [Candidatus Daviesbacteria bacterium GW2011_GWB1_36_5]KKQ81060.1 MAG: Glycosyl transferase family 2 [Candidatus Daviesbacteria bacterium GW2011_GWA1_38_7]OGE17478.1 MAG: hypothetical protein A2858_01045 [Candidatus Daviesbacteria bacterium RIFCSPHIGHO2_01_FULL_36_37]OGE36573.1 MAG: hypothetical protein A3E66_02890 [Candidatus Daviesbacteria bacterium RIFCSPHIGHO2_12_FULL_37_16]